MNYNNYNMKIKKLSILFLLTYFTISLCQNCISIEESKANDYDCIQCSDDYSYCIKCKNETNYFLAINGCALVEYCNKTLNGTCLTCKNGYYLSNSKCLPCYDGCSKCTRKNNCLRCGKYGLYTYEQKEYSIPTFYCVKTLKNYLIFNDLVPAEKCFENSNKLQLTAYYGFSFSSTMPSLIKDFNRPSITLKLLQPEGAILNCQHDYVVVLIQNFEMPCTLTNISQKARLEKGIIFDDENYIFNFGSYSFTIKGLDNPYFLQGVECPINNNKYCEKFNDNFLCEECKYKTFFNKNKTKCIFCSELIEGCDICDNEKCIKCSNDFTLVNNKCIQNFICEENKYPNQNGQCTECEKLRGIGCEKCNIAGYCKSCKKGYYLVGYDYNTYCNKCPYGCSSCYDENYCTECIKGYYIYNGKCEGCPARITGCKNCFSLFTCEDCFEFYEPLLASQLCKSYPTDFIEPQLYFLGTDNYGRQPKYIVFNQYFFVREGMIAFAKYNINVKIFYSDKTNRLRCIEELTEEVKSECSLTKYAYGNYDDEIKLSNFITEFNCIANLSNFEYEISKVLLVINSFNLLYFNSSYYRPNDTDMDKYIILNKTSPIFDENIVNYKGNIIYEKYDQYNNDTFSFHNGIINKCDLIDKKYRFIIKGEIFTQKSINEIYYILLHDNKTYAECKLVTQRMFTKFEKKMEMECKVNSVHTDGFRFSFNVSRSKSGNSFLILSMKNQSEYFCTGLYYSKTGNLSKLVIILITCGAVLILIVVITIIALKKSNVVKKAQIIEALNDIDSKANDKNNNKREERKNNNYKSVKDEDEKSESKIDFN